MDPLTTAAASGMRARLESMDLLANNLANGTTNGFKADREIFNTYLSPDNAEAPVIESHWTDLSQGELEPTGNPLDLALSGPGFLAVKTPQGILFTRNGNLRVNPDGELVTADGYKVLNEENQPIVADPKQALQINRDGTIWQNGGSLGKLQVTGAPAAQGLQKRGGAYFQWTPNAGAGRPAGTEVLQGTRERSNAGTVESAVRMVTVMRQFEALQRAVQLGAEMNRRAVEEVARVTP